VLRVSLINDSQPRIDTIVIKENISHLIFITLFVSFSLINPQNIKFFDKNFTCNFHKFTDDFIVNKSSGL
jgi:hypothetical protein